MNPINLADIIDMATKAGTLPMQVIMLIGLIILGLVARYQYSESKRVADQFMSRLDAREAAMSKERVDRINMLIGIIKDDTEAKLEVTHAIENNTMVIHEIKRLIEDLRSRD